MGLAAAEQPDAVVVDDADRECNSEERQQVWASLSALVGRGCTVLASSAQVPDTLNATDLSVMLLPHPRERDDVGGVLLHSLTTGAHQVTNGAMQVSTALGPLQTGSSTLQTGADQTHSGATEIANVIDGALDKVPDTSPQQTAKAADILGSPVGVSMDNLHPAGVYGRGFAPFFFPIAVWVVGLLAYLFFRPVNLRALAGRVSALTVAVAGWLPVAAITALGGLVLFGVVEAGLGLKPDHPLLVAGLLVLAAGAFVAIDHFLRISFGVIGEALSLVLLIVQLTSCGGLYPIETTPAPFRAIHPVIPMTYLVDGLRVAISGGLADNLIRDVLVLAGFLVAFLGGDGQLLGAQPARSDRHHRTV